ncbi:protein FAM204A [Gossypium australe]|uniref:Protein FAM204A n=1 Tax=Gossypium australe TaxID=47621 RepID=A0A5B6VZ48_9ROSI|nr:protein FAM204A [Gossypium australe]
MGNQKQEEDEDNRRETAIASTRSLQPNFKPVGVTPQQLSKFQELHRRRLQIKAKSKIHKKPKDQAKRFCAKYMNSACSQESDSNTKVEDESVPNSKSHSEDDNPFTLQDNDVVQLATKKRQKLHWGLDTKERWERKANM